MKILFTTLICLLLTFGVKAQLIYNDEDEVVPFSMSEKYKNLIDTSKVNTRKFKSYDNDSLFNTYNQKYGYTKESSVCICGIIVDSTLTDIKTVATKYKIDEGTIWIYKVESKTAEGFSVRMSPLVIPEGGYICFYSNDNEPPRLFLKEDITKPQFAIGANSNQLVIEYFEPKNSTEGSAIILNIGYDFVSRFKKKVNENKLKSGNFGTAVNTCQYNVVCPEGIPLSKGSMSGGYILVGYWDTNGI